jgi:hypothetical protein
VSATRRIQFLAGGTGVAGTREAGLVDGIYGPGLTARGDRWFHLPFSDLVSGGEKTERRSLNRRRPEGSFGEMASTQKQGNALSHHAFEKAAQHCRTPKPGGVRRGREKPLKKEKI